MLICGIDDAGRGPLIGPMVLAGVCFEESELDKIENLGIKDSKLLPHKKREELYKIIVKLAKSYKIIVIQAHEIDEKLDHGTNLNHVEGEIVASIIDILKPDKAIIDCPSTNIKAWKNFVYERLKNKETELQVEHKADFNYKIVGAASILAKVTREDEIKKIKDKYNVEFGSGYSHDERTIEFLKENIDKYPELFRKNWSTYQTHKDKHKQKKISNF